MVREIPTLSGKEADKFAERMIKNNSQGASTPSGRLNPDTSLRIQKDNHTIGCELEWYCEILYYRGFKEESKILLEIASKLK